MQRAAFFSHNATVQAVCSGHGQLTSSGKCSCDYYWLGDTCDISFSDAAGASWTVFVAAVAVIQSTVVLLSIWNLCSRFCRKALGEANYRDIAMIINCSGSIVRLVWLIDPFGLDDRLSARVAQGILLRLPQILWVTAFLLITFVWCSVTYAMNGQTQHLSRLKRIVWSLILLLLCIAVPTTVLFTIGIQQQTMRVVSDGIFVVYAFFMVIAGGWYSSRVVELLQRHQRTANSLQRQRFSQVIWNTACTIIVSTAFGVILIVCLSLVLLFNVQPSTPALYMAVLFVINVVVEGGLAVTMLFSTYQGAVFQNCCQRCSKAPDPGHSPLLSEYNVNDHSYR